MINKIISKHKDKGVEFIKWYIDNYGKIMNINKFLELDDAFKIFIIMIFLETVYGINITGDNFNIVICYSMRYINRKTFDYVKNNNTNVLYETNVKEIPKVFPDLITNYYKAIEYCFDNLI